LSIERLESAYLRENLQASESMLLYTGGLEPENLCNFVGYSLVEGGPLIFNELAYQLDVEECRYLQKHLLVATKKGRIIPAFFIAVTAR